MFADINTQLPALITPYSASPTYTSRKSDTCKAFSSFYVNNYNMLIAYARKIYSENCNGDNKHILKGKSPEDFLHDAYITIFKHKDKLALNDKRKTANYFYQTMKNMYYQLYRSAKSFDGCNELTTTGIDEMHEKKLKASQEDTDTHQDNNNNPQGNNDIVLEFNKQIKVINTSHEVFEAIELFLNSVKFKRIHRQDKKRRNKRTHRLPQTIQSCKNILLAWNYFTVNPNELYRALDMADTGQELKEKDLFAFLKNKYWYYRQDAFTEKKAIKALIYLVSLYKTFMTPPDGTDPESKNEESYYGIIRKRGNVTNLFKILCARKDGSQANALSLALCESIQPLAKWDVQFNLFHWVYEYCKSMHLAINIRDTKRCWDNPIIFSKIGRRYNQNVINFNHDCMDLQIHFNNHLGGGVKQYVSSKTSFNNRGRFGLTQKLIKKNRSRIDGIPLQESINNRYNNSPITNILSSSIIEIAKDTIRVAPLQLNTDVILIRNTSTIFLYSDKLFQKETNYLRTKLYQRNHLSKLFHSVLTLMLSRHMRYNSILQLIKPLPNTKEDYNIKLSIPINSIPKVQKKIDDRLEPRYKYLYGALFFTRRSYYENYKK